MSKDDWGDEINRPDDRGPYASMPKQGMSAGMKTFLIILAVVLLCLLVCCGGIGFFFYKMWPTHSSVPAVVDATRDEIATIHLPPGFQPRQMMNWNNWGFAMKFVMYEDPNAHGHLMLSQIKMSNQGKANNAPARQQMAQMQGFTPRQPLKDAKSETKKLKIKGQEYSFQVVEGLDPETNKKHREVSGSFPGHDGDATIHIDWDEPAYKLDDIFKRIEAIQ